MSEESVTLINLLKVKPGKQDALLALLKPTAAIHEHPALALHRCEHTRRRKAGADRDPRAADERERPPAS